MEMGCVRFNTEEKALKVLAILIKSGRKAHTFRLVSPIEEKETYVYYFKVNKAYDGEEY